MNKLSPFLLGLSLAAACSATAVAQDQSAAPAAAPPSAEKPGVLRLPRQRSRAASRRRSAMSSSARETPSGMYLRASCWARRTRCAAVILRHLRFIRRTARTDWSGGVEVMYVFIMTKPRRRRGIAVQGGPADRPLPGLGIRLSRSVRRRAACMV